MILELFHAFLDVHLHFPIRTLEFRVPATFDTPILRIPWGPR
ncbi:hypothetical protein [Nocardia gipuzkoensis]|nr:hypothetical protein [Nocardia gipuzkoensis]MDE1673760.1 hypothetical protein [Nocardia gipuzkoensis]